MSEDAAAAARQPAALPWGDARPARADLLLMAAITVSGLYALASIPLTPSLVGSHPVLLELLKGSMAGMITMGAMARIGEASLLVAVLAAVPGLMMWHWIYWWAGQRWGKRAIDLFLGNHPKAASRTHRLEKITHRFGWLAMVIVYFQPLPNPLIYAASGWTGMRLRTFLLLDLIGSLLWIGLCVGLGYALGQSAVDVARGISRYALYLTLALVAVVFARQWWVSRR
ncbi:MAG TPA: VTT domain-containing protein [Solirubrobacter sp.]|nr:VTT domain-containing protein [Solirubrobacter sp.]